MVALFNFYYLALKASSNKACIGPVPCISCKKEKESGEKIDEWRNAQTFILHIEYVQFRGKKR